MENFWLIKGDGEELEVDLEGSGLALGLYGLCIVEGFLGVPAADVGALSLMRRNLA